MLGGEKRNAFGIMAEEPEGKRLLGRPKYRYKNIQVDFTEIKCKGVGVNLSGSEQKQAAGCCKHGSEPVV